MALRRVGRFVLERSLLLVAGAAVALVWANAAPASYARGAAALGFAVNDIAMVFFFALAAKEIAEATRPGGALSSRREAAVPLLGAAAGMIVPAALYTAGALLLGRPELLRGWAIPCATDIAFSYLVARAIFPPQHPAVPFLLLLAFFYATGAILPGKLVGLIPAIFIAYLLRRRGVRNFWPYALIAGGVAWVALFRGGIHPALALVPIVPFMPHAKRDLGIYAEHERHLPDTMNQFHSWWHVPVQVILFLFALTNAGVLFSSVGPGSWMVLTSLLLGKPIGIVLFTALSIAAGLKAPGGIRMSDIVLLGITAGIGFTVALFFATAAFPPGPLLDQVKMGALMSFFAFPVALVAARLMNRMGDGR